MVGGKEIFKYKKCLLHDKIRLLKYWYLLICDGEFFLQKHIWVKILKTMVSSKIFKVVYRASQSLIFKTQGAHSIPLYISLPPKGSDAVGILHQGPPNS